MTSINRRNQPPGSSPSRNPPGSPRPPSSNRQNSSVSSANGLGRSPSLRATNGLSRPVRGSVKKHSPNTSFLNTNANVSDEASEDDARAEDAAVLDELRDRLQKAETASEEYRRQLSMLQKRLDESLQEHGKLEDSVHESEAKINDLEDEKVHLLRQKRETETLFESERTAMAQDRSEQKAREENLTNTIQRLKASQKELRVNGDENKDFAMPHSRSRPSMDMENGQFAPPSSLQRSDSNASSKVIVQKDRMIESLRLELVEAQVKLVEQENSGEGRMQELEKSLLETKIANARLMEDNESFQLLLSEKTLNGDFSKTDVMHNSSGLGSLAEELESAEGESENYRRLESEAKSLKAENKALTLYVESIIGRLLQHKEFENILEKTPDLMSGKPPPPASSAAKTEKELPPTPPPKDEEPAPTSLLSRARSVVGGSRRPRPMSHIFSQQILPSSLASPQVSSNPETSNESKENTTAPSAPLTRSASTRNAAHRRSQSEMPVAGGAPLVNHMYRGPPSGTSSALISPGLSPSIASSTAARSSFFNPSTAANIATPPSSQPATASSRIPSGTTSSTIPTNRKPDSSSNSTFSSSSNPNKDPAEVNSTSSPPRNPNAGSHGPQYTGAVMTQNRLRPLRLVQENAGDASEEEREREKARKKANRGSWMPGWMGRTQQQGEGGMF